MLSGSRHDLSTYQGRAAHYFTTTNPLNVLASSERLQRAKEVVEEIQRTDQLPAGMTLDEAWDQKELYDSAYHPDTGELVFLPGRMSFQVPGNMSITGSMMVFRHSTPAVIFWQVANQAFNACVNYSNRNASTPVTMEQLAQSATAATAAGVSVALVLNKIIASSPALSSGIVGRFVPMLSVAAANCVNIPLTRNRELIEGIDVVDEATGDVLGKSTAAAKSAITQVVPSRIGMAAPAMFVPPLIMNKLEKTAMLTKNPWMAAPITVLLTGACLSISTPMCCALFPQTASIAVDDCEPLLQAAIQQYYAAKGQAVPATVQYNKGL